MRILFLLAVLLVWSGRLQAQSIRCSHYIHSNKAGADTTVLKWHEDKNFSLEEEIEKLDKRLLQNGQISETVMALLEKKKDGPAKEELEKALERKVGPSDDLSKLARELGLTARVRTTLITFKKDDFTSYGFDLLGSMEKDAESGLVSIEQGFEFRILNDKSKVLSTYYHHLGSDGLVIPEDRSKIIGEYKQDFSGLEIALEPYGAISAVSYRCLYPAENPKQESVITGLDKLIKELQNKVQALKKNRLKQVDHITVLPDTVTPGEVNPVPPLDGAIVK